MPYDSKSDLPENVTNVLPDHAQDIFKEAYNSAWEQYKSPDSRRGNESHEEAAMKVAWNAVKQKYEKGPGGNWHQK